MATKKVKRAIKEARRIRRNLVRGRKWDFDLGGACGLASILLSIALNDVSILRRRHDHIWCEVAGIIIDITATQFNRYAVKEEVVNGVLISEHPRSYHMDIIDQGLPVYLTVANGNWYTRKDYCRWRSVSEYWM